MHKADLVVVGAGLFGLTVAREAAERWDLQVLVVESRDHIGGNAWSKIDEATRIEYHPYGAHIFHTSNKRVWNWVNRYTEFTDYRHHVWTRRRGRVYPMPISLATINQFARASMSPTAARNWVNEQLKNVDLDEPATNLEERAIQLIGPELYQAFIRDYTFKQWQTDPRHLPADIITRLPVRFNYDTRYFNDTYEGMPLNGYADMMTAIAEHPNIHVELGYTWSTETTNQRDVPTVYTGPIDAFFNYEFGRLRWRTVDLLYTRPDVPDYQGCAVMNAADLEDPHTRTIEFKHFHPERKNVFNGPLTLVAHEFSREAGIRDEPYYPVNSVTDREMLLQYRAEVKMVEERRVIFGGRLGTYKYLDMHMAIASALALVDNRLPVWFGQPE